MKKSAPVSVPVPRALEEATCLCDIRAQVFSLGGIILGSVCIILAILSLMVARLPLVTPLEMGSVWIVALAAWLYFLNCATERLQLFGHRVQYRSCFIQKASIELADLQEMLLVFQGFNLERGMMTIAFRRKGQEPERLTLGPCWQRHKVEDFLHSVEEALHAPKLLEEVR